jgi:hypothetical protein
MLSGDLMQGEPAEKDQAGPANDIRINLICSTS